MCMNALSIVTSKQLVLEHAVCVPMSYVLMILPRGREYPLGQSCETEEAEGPARCSLVLGRVVEEGRLGGVGGRGGPACN